MEGNIISKNHSFNIKFTSLEDEQRNLLVKVYFYRGVLYNQITLKTPKNNIWTAKLDPKKAAPKDLIEQWRVDYLEQQKNTKDNKKDEINFAKFISSNKV